MKNTIFFGMFLLNVFALSAQSSTTTRSLSSFNEIGVAGGFDKVILKEGNEESVVLELNGIAADDIETVVKDNMLQIKTKNKNKKYEGYKAKITVTYRQLKSIACSGSSDIEANSLLKGQKFEVAMSGSGDFKAKFDVKELELAISGSGDMSLRGKAETQEIAISGSGDVNASDLSGSTAEVAISGSGDVKLGVKGKVTSHVSGSGSVSTNK